VSDSYIVKPVAKALQTLTVLGEARQSLSLAELCSRLDIPKTTVFRYLQTLMEYGFVNYNPATDKYSLGLKLWSLGQAAWSRTRLQELARDAMQHLRDQFDETVNLGVIDGREIVYLEMAESHRTLRMHAQLGGRDPVYSTSLGRAMLASLPEDEWALHLPARLTPMTTRTVTTLPALRTLLIETGRRGYSLDDGENEENARCIGAPILDATNRPIAAISVSSPASRMGDDRIPIVAAAVMDAARRISLLSGFQPEAPPNGRLVRS
jgi:IclR family acetate operon transcriptional repressor